MPLEKRICLTVDLDHTLSLEEMQLPMLEDNFEAIRDAYDGQPWPDYTMQFNFGKDKSTWPAERPKYAIEKPRDWFKLTNFAPPYNTIGYLDQFLHDNRTGVFPHYTHEDLQAIGVRVAMAPGLPEFFQKLKEQWAGKAYLSFNLISTGMRDIIDGMPIAKEFDNIFACELFSRGGSGVIDSMADTVQAFSKTRYLIRLAKGGEALIDDVVARDNMAFSYENMICFGDGLSDISHFAYARRKGSNIVCVYPGGNVQAYEKSYNNARLMARVSLLAPRDYEEGQPIWTALNHRIERILIRQCNAKRTTLDDYRKRKMKPAAMQKVSKHIEGCANCAEDVETLSVPPGRNLAVQSGRLVVV